MNRSIRNKIFVILPILLLSSGCIQTNQKLVIKNDGSGTLEANIIIPEGAVYLSGIAAGRDIAQIGEAERGFEPEASGIFSQEILLNKAEKAGVVVDIVEFKQETKGRDTRINFKLSFDNITKFLKAEITEPQFEITKDFRDNLVFHLKGNPKNAEMFRNGLRQYINWRVSREADNTSEEIKEKIASSLKNLGIKFTVVLPSGIKEISGLFNKVDSRTAEFIFSGNILEDPSVINIIYGLMGQPSMVTCSDRGITFDVERVSDVSAGLGISPKSLKPGTEVIITFMNGKVLEAKLIEETDSYIKVDLSGAAITYFFEEIKRIEYIIPQPK